MVDILYSYIIVGSSCGYPISASKDRAHMISFVTAITKEISSAIMNESAVAVCFLLRVRKLPERLPT